MVIRWFVIVACIGITTHAMAQQGGTYIENQGQWNAHAKFLFRGNAFDTWITDQGIVYLPTDRTQSRTIPIYLNFLNTRSSAHAQGIDRATGYHNYFIGNNPDNWVTHVPLYSRISIRNLYDGIDAVFYADRNHPRYDLVISPGADLSQIGMEFVGATTLRIDENGSLVIGTSFGEIRQQELRAYQKIDGKIHKIGCAFRLGNQNRVTFDVGAFDPGHELVIDPVVIAYSTYLGGTESDEGYAIATDGNGNAYITGLINSSDFPVKNAMQPIKAGGYEMFVSKLDAQGALVYSTYLGGLGSDVGNAIAADRNGNAYITGNTQSTDYPLLKAMQPTYGGSAAGDAFVTKLNDTGAISYSTYLGGSDEDVGNGIAVDPNGNAYITGKTLSTNFPTKNAAQSANALGGDVFVTKISSTGALSYSTYLGGQQADEGTGIAVDISGNAYITGTTTSTDYPTKSAMQTSRSGPSDAFVSKLTIIGALQYSTYLGGTGTENGKGISVDRNGNIYVAGNTSSTDYPLLNASQLLYAGGATDAFVTKLNTSGRISYSTYLGGSNDDMCQGLATDPSGNVCVAGYTLSTDFPIVNPAQGVYAGDFDGFVTRLTPSGTKSYSTFLGGSSGEQIRGVAVDTNNCAFVIGETTSTNFPTVNPAQPANAGALDVFITKFALGASVNDPSKETGPSLTIAPNPVRDDLRLTFSLPVASFVALEVVTSNGRSVPLRFRNREFEAGTVEEHISVSDLPSGNYTLRIRTNRGVRNYPFTVVR